MAGDRTGGGRPQIQGSSGSVYVVFTLKLPVRYTDLLSFKQIWTVYSKKFLSHQIMTLFVKSKPICWE